MVETGYTPPQNNENRSWLKRLGSTVKAKVLESETLTDVGICALGLYTIARFIALPIPGPDIVLTSGATGGLLLNKQRLHNQYGQTDTGLIDSLRKQLASFKKS